MFSKVESCTRPQERQHTRDERKPLRDARNVFNTGIIMKPGPLRDKEECAACNTLGLTMIVSADDLDEPTMSLPRIFQIQPSESIFCLAV